MNNNYKKAHALLHRWHFPSTLFVTACVTILHLGTSWLDAFDTYTYVWVGNFVSAVESTDGKANKVAVVEIDNPAYESDFQRRSPLRRDKLLPILERIYAASPELVVIDVDLADAAPGLTAEELPAEAEIARRIVCEANIGAKTVLLKPASETPQDRKPPLADCQKRPDGTLGACKGMGNSPVRFGHGEIPERFGASNWYFKDADSLFAAAQLAMDSSFNPKAETVLLARRRGLIDPRTYFGQLEVISVSKFSKDLNGLTSTISGVLGSEQDEQRCDGDSKPRPRRGVVYFGGAYGGDDLFATPIGRLYGVELHAAAFASCWPLAECENAAEAWHHLKAFVLDLIIGLLLGGFVIRPMWKRYVAWRMNSDPKTQAVAGIAAFRLMCYLVLALALLVLFAGWVLATFGLWLSPIPIAVGMFIEAWVVGPIADHESSAHGATASGHEATVVATSKPPRLFWIAFSPAGLLWTKRCLLWVAVILAAVMIATIH